MLQFVICLTFAYKPIILQGNVRETGIDKHDHIAMLSRDGMKI